MALPDFPDYHKWGFSLAALNSDVYVTGGWPRAPKDPLNNLVLHRPLQPTLLPNRNLESLLRPSRPFYTSESEGFPEVEMGQKLEVILGYTASLRPACRKHAKTKTSLKQRNKNSDRC